MDDLAHESRPIHSLNRKRKADQDDHNVSPSPSDPASPPDSMLIDPQATPRCPADAATPGPSTAPWPIARSRQGMSPWHQPSSPCAPSPFIPPRTREGQPSPKRLRIEIPCTPLASPHRLRRPHRTASRHAGRQRRAGETRDTGIVSATEPGPSRGSLLRTASLPLPSSSSRSVPVSPIEPITISPHIPPHQPPINRETLKELDLEAILRNPQLRHDLLFDSGLQFRPTSSRRKRDLADNYWLAIVRELECGCTCTTLDANGRLTERRCACGILSMPIDRPLIAFSQGTGNTMTVRTPSRIRPLLHELLEVLVSIIQPLQPPNTRPPELLFPPPPQHPQFQQNLTHVALLRQLLDPDLIQQEIDHGLFDPSGVFQAIGDIIRCHCAPMRDAAVDQMVALARSCAPGGSGTKLDAVRAIRMCFEIMELMKLDVANHQLQTLRPYLVRTAAQYEIRTFQETRQNEQLATLQRTRAWLRSAYREAAESSALHSQKFLKHSYQTRVTIAVVKAMVNLIFDPPSVPPSSSAPSVPSSSMSTPASSAASTPTVSSTPLASSRSHSSSSSSSSSSPQFAGYPETFFLDYGRLATLGTDAADFTALYMLLMLYRQLVHSHSHRTSQNARSQVTNDELLKLKKEIWEIGPTHLGLCYLQNRPRPGSSSSRSSSSRHERSERDREAELKKWRSDVGDVVLQVAMRATEPRSLQNPAPEPPTKSAETLRVPEASVLNLANSWAQSNLREGSPLSALMKKRIRECVEDAVLNIVLSAPSSSPTSCPPSLSQPERPSENDAQSQSTSSGLEPLMPEIRHLAERAAKLVTIHTNVYGSLYAHPAFLGLEEPEGEPESDPAPVPALGLFSATPAPASA
ncbi:Tcp11-domain-containing protein [Ganoderma leucocontextum]|nr:Tcp11-domain-containing protein [Ganoderma leucocontextum]